MNKRIKDLALDGTVRQNPTFKLVLGTCPTLAVTTTALNSLGMGLAVTFVLICSNVIISLLRNVIPDKVRIPSFIVIIATFVTIVRMFMEAYIPSLYESLGVFLSLIVVNCIILGRAESYASHNPVGYSALDGLFMGLGFTASITIMGIIREFLGSASIFGFELKKWFPNIVSIPFFTTAAGAFLTYGLLIAIFNVCYNAVDRKIKHNHKLIVAVDTTETAKEAE
ncbi:MAG: electron transport complex subunit E [Clostridia bacterium]|nr:electron transport complex subunit E [Clostridia bacterium]